MVTGFKSLHPIVMAIYYLFTITTVMFTKEIKILILMSFIMLVINLYYFQFRVFLRKIKWPIFIGGVIIVLTPILNQRGHQVLFHIFHWRITEESVMMGLSTALSLLTLLLLVIHYQQYMDHHKFIYVFGKILPQSALLIVMTQSFIPKLTKQYEAISFAQNLNHYETSKMKNVKEVSKRLLMLIGWSLEDGLITADAMTSRGYGSKKRTQYQIYTWHKRDVLILSALIGVLFWFFIEQFRGSFLVTYYPRYIALSIGIKEWILVLLVLMLQGLPIFVEWKEQIQWRLYKSKH